MMTQRGLSSSALQTDAALSPRAGILDTAVAEVLSHLGWESETFPRRKRRDVNLKVRDLKALALGLRA